MKVIFECIWNDPHYQHQVPQELWSYDPTTQIVREAACHAALMPFSLKLRHDLQYTGVADPATCVPPSSSLCSMHIADLPDNVFDNDVYLSEVRACMVAPLSPTEESMKTDIDNIVSQFPNLFSKGQDDLGLICDSDICHTIVVKPSSSPPSRFRSMSSYSERERESSC